MTMVIGLAGRRGAGKDTAGKAFIAAGYYRLAFAEPIKRMMRALLEYQSVDGAVIDQMLEGDLKEEPSRYLGGNSPRHAMQTLGTEWARDRIKTSYWVDTLLEAAWHHDKVVVTDVRFPNEVAAIRAAGGEVIRIVRPSAVSAADSHASEAQIDSLDVHIELENDFDSAEAFTDHVSTLMGLQTAPIPFLDDRYDSPECMELVKSVIASGARLMPGLPVSGYRPQGSGALDQVNSFKALEEHVLRAIDGLAARADLAPDQRWLSIGRTAIEQGFMAVNRSVFKPERVDLRAGANIHGLGPDTDMGPNPDYRAPH